MANAVGGVGMGSNSLAVEDMPLEEHVGENVRT